MSEHAKYAFTFILSLYLSFLLTTFPVPSPFDWLRPSWVVLVLIFWVIQAPAIFGIAASMLAGIVFDVLVGAPLGLHGFTFAVVAFITLLMHKRIKFFNHWQQFGIIFVITGTERLLAYWVSILVGDVTGFSLWPALSSVLFWLPISVALSGFQRLFHLKSL